MMTIHPLDWYYVHLQQDWTICQVIKVEDDVVTVNFHGFLRRFGVPAYEEEVPIEHFKVAYDRSVDGDWSRKYHPNTFDGILFESMKGR